MKQELAKKAAQWWANQLRGRALLDNGDPNPMGMVLSTLLQDRTPEHTEEEIKSFEDALGKDLIEHNSPRVYLGCDYGPDSILSGAATKAGIALTMTDLPWKTWMNIADDKVIVSVGYRGEPKEI